MLDDDALDETETLAELLDESEEDAAAPRPFVDPRTAPVRYSHLKAFAMSPLHYVAAVQHDRESTLAMRLGSAAHAILLQEPIITYPGRRVKGRPRKDGTVKPSAWDRFAEEHADKLIVNPAEYARGEAMANAIAKNADAVRVLLSGTVLEREVRWELHGRPASSRPDAYGPDHFTELKTTRSADPKWFKRDAKKLHYHVQAAMYGQALASTGLSTAKDAYLVAVESAAPYAVSVFRWTENSLAEGDRRVSLWMNRLNSCIESNSWPPYVQAIADLELDFFDDD